MARIEYHCTPPANKDIILVDVDVEYEIIGTLPQKMWKPAETQAIAFFGLTSLPI